MSRIAPLERAELAEHEDALAVMEAVMGFVPNSLLTMGRVPGLLPAFQALAGAVLNNPLLPRDLTQLVAMAASAGAGCRYCQAHTGHVGERLGIPEDKLTDVWSFETSPAFSAAERAALRLAFHAGQVPNAVTDDDVAACREHFDDDQLAAIVATCALFGYLNRWNDTAATTLEDEPASFGQRLLSEGGWQIGKHAP